MASVVKLFVIRCLYLRIAALVCGSNETMTRSLASRDGKRLARDRARTRWMKRKAEIMCPNVVAGGGMAVECSTIGEDMLDSADIQSLLPNGKK